VKNAESFAIASLILGILSVVFFFIHVFVGLICGVVGVILSTMARQDGNTPGMAIGGLVLSILGIVFNAIGLLACAICAGTINSINRSLFR